MQYILLHTLFSNNKQRNFNFLQKSLVGIGKSSTFANSKNCYNNGKETERR